ncbi:bifunctional diguanylate cyclase/phosphodiesterase [Sphingomonas sp. 1P06PA]|uniref:putative bifunctional diguanylate cyclase/phosphodiesterase n=1 Tax=Sphingomonas sp. 1P06PA TaxID=554121 RepID=UPI0039A4A201
MNRPSLPVAGSTPAAARAGHAALFLLSFADREAIAAEVAEAGWRPIAARRADAVDRRFLASGAPIALIDGRGHAAELVAAARALAPVADGIGGALVVIADAEDPALFDELAECGASQIVAGDADLGALPRALRLAQRQVERLAGGARAAGDRASLMAAEAEAWRLDPVRRTVQLSPALAARLGIAGEARLGQLVRRLDPAGRRAAREAVRRLLATGRATAFAHDGAGAERIAHHLHLEEGAGTVVGRIETLSAGMRGDPLPSRDPLTGLGDSIAALRWLEAQIAHGPERPATGCIAMLLEIARYDMVNAAYGRSTGDALLQGVARRIERLVSDGPGRRMVARMAGAEYLIGMPAPVNPDEAMFLAARIEEAVGRAFVSGEHLVTLAARIGLAQSAGPAEDAATLLRRAGAALAEVKAGDGAPIRMDDPGSISSVAHDSRLQVDLRHALVRDQIGILFQPQVDIISGRIVGVEALARWRHPLLGELGAATLFAAAERSDFLVQLSSHVQRRAIAIAAGWKGRAAALRIAVNVTAADIARPGFADQLLRVVDEAGLLRERLTVEVTESGLIEDLGQAATLLATLRAGGLRVAIDDFGTGYSSLAYLKSLPLDYLKIDKRLAQDIAGSQRDRVVVRGVIEMARSLGLAVVAEGVETEDQRELLAAEGCNYYQGFLCAPPLKPAALVRLLAREAKG